MPLVPINPDTPTAEIESMLKLVGHEVAYKGMALAVYLAEALAELLRLRAQLGETMGATMRCRRVTLCGSARFARAYREWTARLMLHETAMVYTAPLIQTLKPAQKARIDEVWFAQIAASDEIFVLDIGGYVGNSTRNEIEFAEARGIPVRYLSKVEPGWTEADCVYAPDMVDAPAPRRPRAAKTKA